MHDLAPLGLVLALQPLMQLHRALGEQEDTAANQDQVSAREGELTDAEQRLGERNNPRDREKQSDPHHQRERQADHARLVALMRWQLVREDRNKDEVVDAENDLKDDKGPKTDPDIRIRKKFHDDSYKFSRAAERKRPRAESPRPSRCALVIGRGLR